MQLPEARKMNAFRSVWRRIYLHDECVLHLSFRPYSLLTLSSWTSIRYTVNATDAEITQRFRNTALYQALLSTLHSPREYTSTEGFILDASEALAPPTLAQVQSRWPGVPDEDIEEILQDFEWESEQLKELGLEDVVERIKELALSDFQ
jgi:nuclear pore complex protein Nup133